MRMPTRALRPPRQAHKFRLADTRPDLLRRAGVQLARTLLCVGGAVSSAWAADPPDPASGGLSLLAPGDGGLRADVAWLVDRGVLQLPLGTWPLPSSMVRAAWSGLDANRLAPADADALARVQRAVLRSTDTARMAAQVNTARHPAVAGDAQARGVADGTLAFYAGSAEWGGRLALGFTAENLTPDGQWGNLDGSYVAVMLPGAVLSAGAADRWWGPGQFTSPIMSTAARPIAGVSLRRAEDNAPETSWLHWIGRWGYELSIGRLAHYDPQGTRLIGIRLYTRPWANVEIGLSRSILWGGLGRPHSARSFADALLGRSNVDDPSDLDDDPSDEISGLDFRISAADPWGGSWVGYGHLVGEDEAGGLPTKLFGTVGLQAKAVFGRQRIDATLESTDTMPGNLFGLGTAKQPPAYAHASYVDGYYQGRLPIGAVIGGGGRLTTFGLGWTPIDNADQLRVVGTVFGGQMSQQQPQATNATFGRPGALRGLSLAVDGETPGGIRWQVGVSVQHYAAGGRPVTGLQASIDVPIYTGR